MKARKDYVFDFGNDEDSEPLLVTVFDHFAPQRYGIHSKGVGPNDVSLHLNRVQLDNLFLELQKHQTIETENQS